MQITSAKVVSEMFVGARFYRDEDDSTWIIRAYVLGMLRERLEKLNKRTRKTGGEGLGLDVVERIELSREEPLGGFTIVDGVTVANTVTRTLEVVRVRITGAVPAITNHVFLARVEHHTVGNIVARAPGQEATELPLELRAADARHCDHCGTERRRKETYVLRAPDGSLKRIGRNCLADFLRTADADNALRMWDLWGAVRDAVEATGEEGYGSGWGGCSQLDTEDYLAHVAACVRVVGWVSKARSQSSDLQATSALALQACGPKPQDPRSADMWRSVQPTAEDRLEAAAVIAWGVELSERANLTDYIHNLRVAAALTYVGGKNLGLVASAVAAYRKDREFAVKQVERATKPVGAHVGVVGERSEFELTVIRVRYSANAWGASTIVAFEDAYGNELVWFASGNKEFSTGDIVRGKGTVKKHSAFNGRPQTELTRCAFDKVEPASQDTGDAAAC